MKLDRITRLNTRKKIGKLTRISHRFKWCDEMLGVFGVEDKDKNLPSEFMVTITKTKAIFVVRYFTDDFKNCHRVFGRLAFDIRHIFVKSPNIVVEGLIERYLENEARIASTNILEAHA